MPYYTPAEYVLRVFGGPQKTAVALGMHRSSVHHWTTRYRGRVPSKMQSKILSVAEERKLDITASDLIQGRRAERVLTRIEKQRKLLRAGLPYSQILEV